MGAPADHAWCAAGIGVGAAVGYHAGRRSARGRRMRRVKRPPPPGGRRRHARVSKRGSPTMRSWPGWRSAAQRERREDGRDEG